MDGGRVTITESYEGMEGANVLIRNGELSVTASDDGINAAGEDGLQGDVVIEGGSLYLNASGDAVDSNRSILPSLSRAASPWWKDPKTAETASSTRETETTHS